MRIGGFNQIAQIYNNSTVKQTKSPQKPGFSAALEISGAGKDYQTARQALASVSDVREDVVADIKSRIADGSYQVSNSALADKLLSQSESFI